MRLPALADALAHVDCEPLLLMDGDYSEADVAAVAAVCTAGVAPEKRRTLDAVSRASATLVKLREEAERERWRRAHSEAMREVPRRITAGLDQYFIREQFKKDIEEAYRRQPESAVVLEAAQNYSRLVATSLWGDGISGDALCHCVAEGRERIGDDYEEVLEETSDLVAEIKRSPRTVELGFVAEDYAAMERYLRLHGFARTRNGKLVDGFGNVWEALDFVRSYVSSVTLVDPEDPELKQVSGTDKTAKEVLSLLRARLPLFKDAGRMIEVDDNGYFDRDDDSRELKRDVEAVFEKRFHKKMAAKDWEAIYAGGLAEPWRPRRPNSRGKFDSYVLRIRLRR